MIPLRRPETAARQPMRRLASRDWGPQGLSPHIDDAATRIAGNGTWPSPGAAGGAASVLRRTEPDHRSLRLPRTTRSRRLPARSTLDRCPGRGSTPPTKGTDAPLARARARVSRSRWPARSPSPVRSPATSRRPPPGPAGPAPRATAPPLRSAEPCACSTSTTSPTAWVAMATRSRPRMAWSRSPSTGRHPRPWTAPGYLPAGPGTAGRSRSAPAPTSGLLRLTAAPTRRVHAVLGADGQVHLAGGSATVVAAAATKKVAVLLFDFSDDASQPYTPASTTAIAFSNGNAMANYFDEESRGAVTVSGSVFGWYQIAASKATCDPFAWATQARAAASAAGVNLTSYTNVVFAFPREASCAWAGPRRVCPGRRAGTTAPFDLRVVAHELGHNFGVHHASSLQLHLGWRPRGALRELLVVGVRRPVHGDGQRQLRAQPRHPPRPVRLAPGDRGRRRRAGRSVHARLGPRRPVPAGSPRLLRIDRHNGTWFYLDLRSVPRAVLRRLRPVRSAVNGVTVRISPDAPGSELWCQPDSAGRHDARRPRPTPTPRWLPARAWTIPCPASASRRSAWARRWRPVSVLDTVAPGAPGGFAGDAVGAVRDLARVDRCAGQLRASTATGSSVTASTSGTATGTRSATTARRRRRRHAYRLIAVDRSGNEGPAATARPTTHPGGSGHDRRRARRGR